MDIESLPLVEEFNHRAHSNNSRVPKGVLWMTFHLFRLRIICRIVENHWQKWLSRPLEYWRIQPIIEQLSIIALSWTLLQLLVSPQTIERYFSCDQWTLHAWEAFCEKYLSTSTFSFAFSFLVQLRLTRTIFTVGIKTNDVLFANFDSNIFLIFQGLPICIMLCTAFVCISSSSVWIACINILTAD